MSPARKPVATSGNTRVRKESAPRIASRWASATTSPSLAGSEGCRVNPANCTQRCTPLMAGESRAAKSDTMTAPYTAHTTAGRFSTR